MNEFQNNKNNLNEIRKKLESFRSYPKKEIPLKDIEKIIIRQLGCRREKSRRGSAVKYYHYCLEDHPLFTGGIFCVHILHGKSKSNPQIKRSGFKKYLLPALEIILDKLEEGE
ncbi:MAG: hypothetical protein ACTSWE_15670 [Promethearchaeota archaeon]